eukprot:scaffold15108_cov180-Amphora_coffeaeformis.AAC.42
MTTLLEICATNFDSSRTGSRHALACTAKDGMKSLVLQKIRYGYFFLGSLRLCVYSHDCLPDRGRVSCVGGCSVHGPIRHSFHPQCSNLGDTRRVRQRGRVKCQYSTGLGETVSWTVLGPWFTISSENLAVLVAATLCSDADHETEILASAPEKTRAMNNSIRTKLCRLVMTILPVRPYQERGWNLFIRTANSNDSEIQKGTRDLAPRHAGGDGERGCNIIAADDETGPEAQDVIQSGSQVGAPYSGETEFEPHDAERDIEVRTNWSEDTASENIELDVEVGTRKSEETAFEELRDIELDVECAAEDICIRIFFGGHGVIIVGSFKSINNIQRTLCLE